MKPWNQEPMWVRRNDQGVVVGFEENLPPNGDFIPTVPMTVKRNPKQYTSGEMNKHDQRRKEALVASLLKAKERAAEALLYLTANNRDPEEINAAGLAVEHIDIALEHLGVTLDATTAY